MHRFLWAHAARVVAAIVASLTLTGCVLRETPHDTTLPSAVTPATARFFIARGKTRSHTVYVDTTNVPPSMEPVDVTFVIDVSSSMDRQLDPVRRSAAQILEVVSRNNPDTRFALASFSDYYPAHSRDPRDYPWRLDQSFTSDHDAIRRSLDNLRIVHGGDVPESYSRALSESVRLGWRPNARKILVLLGDSVAHDVDPGPDGLIGTLDDLRFEDVVATLKAAGIVVLGIFEPKSPEVRKQFEQLATATGGRAMALRRGTDAPAAVLAGLTRSVKLPPRLAAQDAFREWIPAISAPGSVDADLAEFRLTLAAPKDASMGPHRLQVVATHAHRQSDLYAEIGHAEILIVTGWLNDPAWQRLAFAVVALPSLLWAIRLASHRWGMLDGYHFNAWPRWRHLIRQIFLGALVAAYLAALIAGYWWLTDSATPPVSDLLASANSAFASALDR